MKKAMFAVPLIMLLCVSICAAADGWISLFDGKTLDGWKANERPEDWKVVDGAIHGIGRRSHLFYMKEEFKNFEFKVDIKTLPKANAGVYFHTKYQPSGWPSHGYESQVNVSHGDPVKTGSLYNTVLVNKNQVKCKDNQWWTQHIIVNKNRVIVKIYPTARTIKEINTNPFDEFTVVNFMEPAGVTGPKKLSKGLFAFQQHDPGSKVFFKNIMVKKLPN